MTTTREDPRDAGVGALAVAERSAVAGIRGLRWWLVVVVALVLTVVGVAADLLQSGELGIFYTVCFPVGGILAAVWVRRGEMFATCVQPPLLLAIGVPVAIVSTGSLPRTGGLTALVLALGGPMINGFPVMAITTAVCLAIAFVRSHLQPLTGDADDVDRPPRDRDRDDRDRDDRDRDDRDRAARERAARDRAERDRRDRAERDRRDRAERDRPARPAERRPDERRGEPGRPGARPARPADAAKNPARRPADEPPAPRGEGFGPGVYRVPRPPQNTRPGGRPSDGPQRPKRPGPPPGPKG